jgi:hypothetical protein
LKKDFHLYFPSSLVGIVSVTLESRDAIISSLKIKQDGGEKLIVVNLCDGTEDDGYVGLSVVFGLQIAQIPFTGAGSQFYSDTTSKPVLKRVFHINLETYRIECSYLAVYRNSCW